MRDVDGNLSRRAPLAAPEPAAPRDRRVHLLVAGLLAASALIVVLGWQNGRLRAAHHEAAERADLPYVGMFVPLVSARAIDGTTRMLGSPLGAPQILYFFTTQCRFCRASVPAVVALAQRLGSADLIGVGAGATSADDLRAYARTHGFGFPIVELPDDRARALYRSRDVPMVMVVDGDGRVRYRHVGQLAVGDVDEIVAAAAIPAAQRGLSFEPGVLP